VTLMLLLDPAGSGVEVGESRLLATVLAALLVLVGATVLAWLARRHPAPAAEAELTASLVRSQDET
jgi:hypothetical protein